MQQHRPRLRRIAQVPEHRHEMLHVVAVDRPDVVEAELLEQRAAGHQAARILLGALGGDLDGLGEALDDLAAQMAQRAELLGRSEEHTSELQSLMRISYAVFCLKTTKS